MSKDGIPEGFEMQHGIQYPSPPVSESTIMAAIRQGQRFYYLYDDNAQTLEIRTANEHFIKNTNWEEDVFTGFYKETLFPIFLSFTSNPRRCKGSASLGNNCGACWACRLSKLLERK